MALKMFYATQVHAIDVCRMPIIFYANFPPSCSLQQVASRSSRGYTTHRCSLFVRIREDFSAFARLIMGVIYSANDARNTEIFSLHKRKRNFHGYTRLVGLCPPIPLRRPRSNLMIMREPPVIYSDFIACEMWPFFLL